MSLLRFALVISMLLYFPMLLANTACNSTCNTNKGPCVNPCPPPEKPQFKSCPGCCSSMGGISYCDSSAGRFVCNNGFYSSCYCSRHAIMDLQKIEGCCLWQGGVMAADATGLVVCNNGSISEVCSKQFVVEKAAVW